ncbi:MAG: hypothetical protein HFE63_02855 [Clostridiales bacterium]|nr:hypothetical protein [Clostridiales bacterium]
MAICTAGTKIRFVLNSGRPKITLRMNNAGTSTYTLPYFGDVQLGWI